MAQARRLAGSNSMAIGFAVFLLLSAVPIGAQQTTASRITALRRAFHPAARVPHAERVAAIAELGDADGRSVATALLRVYRQLDAEIAALESEHLAMNRALHDSVEVDAETKKRGGANARRQARRRLRVQSIESRDALDPKRLQRRLLGQRIERLRDPAALGVITERALRSTKAPFHARLAAARAIAHSPTGRDACLKALRTAKDDASIAVGLTGLELALHRAHPADVAASLPALRTTLQHPAAGIRELTARCLGVSRSPDAIPMLIELLATSRGELQQRVADLLATATGTGIGPVAPAWQAWWQDHEASIRSGEQRLSKATPSTAATGTGAIRKPAPPRRGGGRRPGRRPAPGRRPRAAPATGGRPPAPGGTTYMGIPQNGSSIVYVVDASLSMKVAVDFNVPGLTLAGGGDATRLDACKAELLRALAGLSPEQKFNIVYFHETAGRFRPAPVAATPDNVNAARRFVRKLEMKFATNIHDGLFEAFADLAKSLRSRPLGDGIDTVFLLTDGQPANLVPPGLRKGQARTRGDSAQKLLAMIDDADPLDRVVLHCIGIGRGLNQRLLRALAAARGGIAKFY